MSLPTSAAGGGDDNDSIGIGSSSHSKLSFTVHRQVIHYLELDDLYSYAATCKDACEAINSDDVFTQLILSHDSNCCPQYLDKQKKSKSFGLLAQQQEGENNNNNDSSSDDSDSSDEDGDGATKPFFKPMKKTKQFGPQFPGLGQNLTQSQHLTPSGGPKKFQGAHALGGAATKNPVPTSTPHINNQQQTKKQKKPPRPPWTTRIACMKMCFIHSEEEFLKIRDAIDNLIPSSLFDVDSFKDFRCASILACDESYSSLVPYYEKLARRAMDNYDNEIFDAFHSKLYQFMQDTHQRLNRKMSKITGASKYGYSGIPLPPKTPEQLEREEQKDHWFSTHVLADKISERAANRLRMTQVPKEDAATFQYVCKKILVPWNLSNPAASNYMPNAFKSVPHHRFPGCDASAALHQNSNNYLYAKKPLNNKQQTKVYQGQPSSSSSSSSKKLHDCDYIVSDQVNLWCLKIDLHLLKVLRNTDVLTCSAQHNFKWHFSMFIGQLVAGKVASWTLRTFVPFLFWYTPFVPEQLRSGIDEALTRAGMNNLYAGFPSGSETIQKFFFASAATASTATAAAAAATTATTASTVSEIISATATNATATNATAANATANATAAAANATVKLAHLRHVTTVWEVVSSVPSFLWRGSKGFVKSLIFEFIPDFTQLPAPRDIPSSIFKAVTSIEFFFPPYLFNLSSFQPAVAQALLVSALVCGITACRVPTLRGVSQSYRSIYLKHKLALELASACTSRLADWAILFSLTTARATYSVLETNWNFWKPLDFAKHIYNDYVREFVADHLSELTENAETIVLAPAKNFWENKIVSSAAFASASSFVNSQVTPRLSAATSSWSLFNLAAFFITAAQFLLREQNLNGWTVVAFWISVFYSALPRHSNVFGTFPGEGVLTGGTLEEQSLVHKVRHMSTYWKGWNTARPTFSFWTPFDFSSSNLIADRIEKETAPSASDSNSNNNKKNNNNNNNKKSNSKKFSSTASIFPKQAQSTVNVDTTVTPGFPKYRAFHILLESLFNVLLCIVRWKIYLNGGGFTRVVCTEFALRALTLLVEYTATKMSAPKN